MPYSLNILRGGFFLLILWFWGLPTKILSLKYLDLHVVYYIWECLQIREDFIFSNTAQPQKICPPPRNI